MKQEEQRIHMAIADWLRLVDPDCIWFHIPNGGARSVWTGAILKRMGVTPGVPDLLFLNEGKAFFIEIKNATGRLSKSQIAFIERCKDNGIPVCIAKDIDDVRLALADWGIATREVA